MRSTHVGVVGGAAAKEVRKGGGEELWVEGGFLARTARSVAAGGAAAVNAQRPQQRRSQVQATALAIFRLVSVPSTLQRVLDTYISNLTFAREVAAQWSLRMGGGELDIACEMLSWNFARDASPADHGAGAAGGVAGNRGNGSGLSGGQDAVVVGVLLGLGAAGAIVAAVVVVAARGSAANDARKAGLLGRYVYGLLGVCIYRLLGISRP